MIVRFLALKSAPDRVMPIILTKHAFTALLLSLGTFPSALMTTLQTQFQEPALNCVQ